MAPHPRARRTQTDRVEFDVPAAKVVEALIDPSEVLPGDEWSFVQGAGSLILVRDRVTFERFAPPPGPPAAPVASVEDAPVTLPGRRP